MLPDIEVACYAYEGINAVKDALRAGLSLSQEDLEVKVSRRAKKCHFALCADLFFASNESPTSFQINLIAPPLYVVTTVSLDKDKGIDLLKEVLEKIRAVITEKKGSMNVKMEPRAVTETDERELMNMMEKCVLCVQRVQEHVVEVVCGHVYVYVHIYVWIHILVTL